MNDFRLKVFLSVANNLSFTKAGNELHISQPAISQNIKELENLYDIQLFERTKNTISLTSQGKIFLSYAIDIDSKYQELEFEINSMSQKKSGSLSIGASTTIAQYLLPSIIAKYMARFPKVKLSVLSGNSEQIEDLLLNHKIDLGIIEGGEHKKEFNYSVFAKDELVLLTSSKNKVKEEITLEELKTLPLVLRENGSGTLAEIIKALKNKNIKETELNTTLQMGSTESIKRFIKNGNSYGIISMAAIFDELYRNELQIIEITNLRIDRDFSFISIAGSKNKLSEEFCNFAKIAYKKIL